MRKNQGSFDLTSGGIFSAVLGDRMHPEILKTINDCNIVASYGEEHYQATKLKEELKELTGFESVVLFSTGSEACEAFWRACSVYYDKPNIWGGLVDPDKVGTNKALADAMHGWTLGSLIMAGKMSWPELNVHPELGAARFGQQHDSTCGMIMEPYHGPSAQFHHEEPTIARVRELQNTFEDIPLCMDEVQGGLYRTGKLFAHYWYNPLLKPQFATMGKALGGGFPISALLGPAEILEDKDVIAQAHLTSTHSNHPVMAAIARTVLRVIEEEQLDLRSFNLGEWMYEKLNVNLSHISGVTVHGGRGLLAGIKFPSAEIASRIAKKCLVNGVRVVDTGRKWIKLGPAYNIITANLEAGINILIKTIKEDRNESNFAAQWDSGEESGESGAALPESRLLPAGTSGETESSKNDG